MNPQNDLITAALVYVGAGRAYLAALNARGSYAEASRFASRQEWRELERAANAFTGVQGPAATERTSE